MAFSIFHSTALPVPVRLEEPPPLTSRQLLMQAMTSPQAHALTEAVLLMDDLMQRESVLAGEGKTVEPAVLTKAQVRNEEPLPVSIFGDAGVTGRKGDPVWAAYFEYAYDVARKHGSELLENWISFEVGLRNALARVRAEALGLDPEAYLVVPRLGNVQSEYSSVVSQWRAAEDAVDGQRILLQARWEWIWAHDGWFSFSEEEVAAYAVKLELLKQWQRLGK
jgi:hypothetical protein